MFAHPEMMAEKNLPGLVLINNWQITLRCNTPPLRMPLPLSRKCWSFPYWFYQFILFKRLSCYYFFVSVIIPPATEGDILFQACPAIRTAWTHVYVITKKTLNGISSNLTGVLIYSWVLDFGRWWSIYFPCFYGLFICKNRSDDAIGVCCYRVQKLVGWQFLASKGQRSLFYGRKTSQFD